MPKTNHNFEDRVIIVGVGLIGGSIAATIRQRFPSCEVIGVGRCEKRLASAKTAGLLTGGTTSLSAELLAQPSVVVICLPVDMIADQVQRIAELSSDGIVITDAGSVKGAICQEVAKDPAAQSLFVGAHPIAGGEQGGFENAEADLFDGRVCVVVDSEDETRTSRVNRFWQGLGCEVVSMTAGEHDRALALTSHLPHVMAAVTAAAVGVENLPLTGSGFRDATRIAAGDSSLWKAILAGNRTEVISAIVLAEHLLKQYRTALELREDVKVERLLRIAADQRSQLDC
jgi:prephenate dehydrogenase